MEEPIELEGRILAVLAGTMFRVKMEMSPHHLDKARIVCRLE